MKNLLILIILIGLFGCSESVPNTENQVTSKDSIVYQPIYIEYEKEKSIEELPDTTFVINIQNQSIVIKGLMENFFLDVDGNYLRQSNDTAYLWIGDMQGIDYISLLDKEWEDYTIHQCYQTSMYILDDGKVFELTDWKHYQSKWIENPGQDLFSYSEFDHQNFPKYTQEELKKAVQEYFSYSEYRLKSYTQLLSNPKYANQMLHTFVSKTTFKITDLKNNKSVYVVLNHGYGC